MKKSVGLWLAASAVLICLCLTACGTDDPALGEYECAARSSYGYDIGTDDSAILLDTLFRGRLYIAGGSYRLFWFEKDGGLTVFAGGEKYYGSVGDGIIALDLGGVKYSFCKPGVELDPEREQTELQQLWNGSWYGYWNVKEPTGAWAANDEMTYRCEALIDLDEYGQGLISIWDEDSSREAPMAEVSISVSADGASAVSSGGYFWMADVTGNEWKMSLYEEEIPQLIMLGQHYEGDEGGFRFELLLSRKTPDALK